ncbi:MAG: proton-conducting transporter membrane subunit [Polyangiaceae bacterium]
MAGPTPVSALIHAATMVTAGVYLVARMSFVFVLSPAVMATVAVIGALTAIFAASMGLFQRDLKKVLAYSTVSQLGFMFIGVGTGSFVAGFFHVFTHAFFKACLFLGAGSVIHAMHARIHDTDASQDMNNMGGLRKYLPITHITFLLSCLSIAGMPFFAGFWSKDEILWKAYSGEIHASVVNTKALQFWTWPAWLGQAIYWVGIVAASMTAFYMFRAYFMTFWGNFRGWTIVPGWKDPHAGKHHHHHDHEDEKAPKTGPVPHESPLAMTAPLILLAVFAVGAGWLGAEALHVNPLTHKLEHLFEAAQGRVHVRAGVDEHGSQMWLMMLPGFLAFVGGAGLAYIVYVGRNGDPERSFAASAPWLYKLLYNKWYVDEIYEYTVIGMVDALADIFVMADVWIVDGVLAKLSSLIVKATGSVLRLFQTGRVQVYAASMVLGVVGIGWYVSTPHAAYTLDETELKRSGTVVVHATSGLGYSYKWSGDGIASKDFSSEADLSVVVEEGKTRTVVLEVKNAIGRESKETITISRPSQRSAGVPPGMMLKGGGM